MNFLKKISFLFLLSGFMLIPFVSGILSKGYIPLRSLIEVPFILIGWLVLGLKTRPKVYLSLQNSVVILLTVFCGFQFASSNNHLFSSSHLALVEDRLLGLQLIERIEATQAEAGSPQIQYLEMIGYVQRPSIPSISRIENIGASFWGWDQGHAVRATSFLATLGYSGLEPLPLDQRGEFVGFAEAMPVWPAFGSVQVIGNVVLVKFGPYSDKQKSTICGRAENLKRIQSFGFCP
jgi:hypothetical protein